MHLLPRRLLLLTTARIFETRKIAPAPAKYMDLTKRNGRFFQHNKRFLWEKWGQHGIFRSSHPCFWWTFQHLGWCVANGAQRLLHLRLVGDRWFGQVGRFKAGQWVRPFGLLWSRWPMNIMNIDCNSLPLILNTPPNGPNYVEIPTKKKTWFLRGCLILGGGIKWCCDDLLFFEMVMFPFPTFTKRTWWLAMCFPFAVKSNGGSPVSTY